MNKSRDDFSEKVKLELAKRVCFHCSCCDQRTSGPNSNPSKASIIGVAAHITAAAEGGPRYDPTLTPEQRKSIDNGIWLCENHAKLVDSDTEKYTVEFLNKMKEKAEKKALNKIEIKKEFSTKQPEEKVRSKKPMLSIKPIIFQGLNNYFRFERINEQKWNIYLQMEVENCEDIPTILKDVIASKLEIKFKDDKPPLSLINERSRLLYKKNNTIMPNKILYMDIQRGIEGNNLNWDLKNIEYVNIKLELKYSNVYEKEQEYITESEYKITYNRAEIICTELPKHSNK